MWVSVRWYRRLAIPIVPDRLRAAIGVDLRWDGEREGDGPCRRSGGATSERTRATVERAPVESTSIVSAGYDAERRLLEIEFVGGGVYRYFEVPTAVIAGFLAADSKGRFVNQHVRDRFRYERLAP